MELGEIANNIQVYGLGLGLAVALELVTQVDYLLFWVSVIPLPFALVSVFLNQQANNSHTLSWYHGVCSGMVMICSRIAKACLE